MIKSILTIENLAKCAWSTPLDEFPFAIANFQFHFWLFLIELLKCNKIESKDVFRWHDSGDLQGVWHLANIAKVAVLSPKVRFWLPTIEYDIVEDYLKGGGVIPKNLHIMLSAEYIDEPHAVRRVAKKLNMYSGVKNAMGVSWVTRDRKIASCPATTIRHKCLDCRECWSSMEVVYHIHWKQLLYFSLLSSDE